MKVKLATVNLQVTDPQRSRRFFEDVLGLAEDPRRSHPPGFVYLRSDGCDVTLATPPEAAAEPPARSVELGFETDDLPAVRAHLAARGVRDVREESMGWGDALELLGPDGHRVVIYAFRRGGEPRPH